MTRRGSKPLNNKRGGKRRDEFVKMVVNFSAHENVKSTRDVEQGRRREKLKKLVITIIEQ